MDASLHSAWDKTRKRLLPRALATQEMLLSCLEPAQRELFIDLMSHVVMANEKYIPPRGRSPKTKIALSPGR